MFERGLAYKKRSFVNWCPKCETVLANEQVEQGACWRRDSLIEQRPLDQWFFKITAYAKELLDETHNLKGWPERVLIMQREWIGQSEGAEVDFPVDDKPGQFITIFTTRPDTLIWDDFHVARGRAPIGLGAFQGDAAGKGREGVRREGRQDGPGQEVDGRL